MSSDDLIEQLVQIIQDSRGKHSRHSSYSPQRIARAVLASSLVIPTSAVNNLAEEWESIVPGAASRLRALTRQENP